MTKAAARTLLESLTGHRAVLLLGQNYRRGLQKELIRSVAGATDSRPSSNIVGQFGASGVTSNTLARIQPIFRDIEVGHELPVIAEQPWNLVLTSAIDGTVVDVFRQSGAPRRQLRIVTAGHIRSVVSPHGASELLIIRLLGSVDERDSQLQPPMSEMDLRRRMMFGVAPILEQLPVYVGPNGSLVISSFDDGDLLDMEALALACEPLPSESVHVFADCSPAVRAHLSEILGDRAVLHDDTISEQLASLSGTSQAEELAKARDKVLRPSTKVITCRTPKGHSRTIRLQPTEWRGINHIGVILDDGIVNVTQELTAGERQNRFRDFLHRVQKVPDWDAIARGFLFEREIADGVLREIEEQLTSLGSVHESDVGDETVTSSRLPILISAPPASGKTRLLHWLAFQLKQRGHCVLYVFASGARLQAEQLARVTALLESRGSPATAIVIDDLEAEDYVQLNESLASRGRNVVVVGAVNRIGPADVSEPDDSPDPSRTPNTEVVTLRSSLSPSEADRFRDFLVSQGYDRASIPELHLRDRYFLLLLYRLLPDSRGNIHLALIEEYERLLSALESIEVPESEPPSNRRLQDQLESVRRQLFRDATGGSPDTPDTPYTHDPEMREAVHLILFTSQLGMPFPVDLLLRSRGTAFMRNYSSFLAALESTALIQEVELDLDGSQGLSTEHPFVAKLALRPIYAEAADQLDLLSELTRIVNWDDDAYPGENPAQDFVIDVLQAVGPRGSFADEFDSPAALERIANRLQDIRAVHGASIPKLLLLEANTQRLLAAREDEFIAAKDRFDSGLDALNQAEEILSARRPSDARNGELANVLTTRAAVHGYIAGAALRNYRGGSDTQRAYLRSLLFNAVEEVHYFVDRARALGVASFYPIDVDFWAHRDLLEQLPDLGERERTRMLARLESIMDLAHEDLIEASQIPRYRRRAVNLAELRGKHDVSADLAAQMRAEGDFSGECVLVRSRTYDSETNRPRNPESALQGLEYLEEFAPAVYTSQDATLLMHFLWMGAFLPRPIGGNEPILAAVETDDWRRWARITEARLTMSGNEGSPYLSFCLGWAQLQLDQPAKASQTFRASASHSYGNRRRIGVLSVVTREDGSPWMVDGIVRRQERGDTVLYVSRLMTEVRMSARTRATLTLEAVPGDQLRFAIGLNYRGPVAWVPDELGMQRPGS